MLIGSGNEKDFYIRTNWGKSESLEKVCTLGSIWVFRPCMVQQMLHIGNASKGKTPRSWHLWNIKIPKPPYISSLKITGLLHFSNFLGLPDEIYNPQSLWITLYQSQLFLPQSTWNPLLLVSITASSSELFIWNIDIEIKISIECINWNFLNVWCGGDMPYLSLPNYCQQPSIRSLD